MRRYLPTGRMDASLGLLQNEKGETRGKGETLFSKLLTRCEFEAVGAGPRKRFCAKLWQNATLVS